MNQYVWKKQKDTLFYMKWLKEQLVQGTVTLFQRNNGDYYFCFSNETKEKQFKLEFFLGPEDLVLYPWIASMYEKIMSGTYFSASRLSENEYLKRELVVQDRLVYISDEGDFTKLEIEKQPEGYRICVSSPDPSFSKTVRIGMECSQYDLGREPLVKGYEHVKRYFQNQ